MRAYAVEFTKTKIRYWHFITHEQGDGTIESLRNMLLDLRTEQEKLDSLTKELVEEHNRKQKHIDVS